MARLHRLNLQSTEYTGNTTLPAKQNRGYFFIVMTSGEGTIAFGNGTGQVPLSATAFYEPYVAPISEITITTLGTFVVVEG